MMLLYFFRIVDRRTEIELPFCSSMRRKRGLTERMYGSNFAAAALTPASSDDEMETSFTSYERTGMCLTNPLYDLGLNSSADVSGAESPLPEEGTPKSEKQKQVHVK